MICPRPAARRTIAWVACALAACGSGGLPAANGISLLPDAEYFVAIDNVCAWPRLLRLPGGDIVAAIYNDVEHGMTMGNVDLWGSADGGRTWSRRSTVSDHGENPAFVRMNHALGLAADGSLVALVSGWSERRAEPLLPLQVCLSRDQGRTWQRGLCAAPEIAHLVPHGDVVTGPDGALTASLYGRIAGGEGRREVGHRAFTARSRDHGRTWGDLRPLADSAGETSLLLLRSGRWLAAARRDGGSERLLASTTAPVTLHTSADGLDWTEAESPVTLPGQHPASLLELRDGRILLSYGSRITGLYGVCARMSEDGGQTWSRPKVLVGVPGPLDGGYPSTVERDDGALVTAYYAGPRAKGRQRELSPRSLPWHQRYHMGVCIWRPTDFEFVR